MVREVKYQTNISFLIGLAFMEYSSPKSLFFCFSYLHFKGLNMIKMLDSSGILLNPVKKYVNTPKPD